MRFGHGHCFSLYGMECTCDMGIHIIHRETVQLEPHGDTCTYGNTCLRGATSIIH